MDPNYCILKIEPLEDRGLTSTDGVTFCFIGGKVNEKRIQITET